MHYTYVPMSERDKRMLAPFHAREARPAPEKTGELERG